MKKGFTLIELLAVIILLAIIVLIATPIILQVINTAKEGSDKSSLEMYAKAVENGKYLYRLNNKVKPTGKFITSSDGNLVSTDGKIVLEIDFDDDIVCDTIHIYDDQKLYITDCKQDGKPVDYTYGKKQGYDNGEIVYFDILKGKGCKESEYKKSWDETLKDYLNSETGYNGIKEETDTTNSNSCLKFYAFSDNGEKTVNLLLDHNTTASVIWATGATNKNGPNNLLAILKTDTESWQGTITPKNYTTGPTERTYTIDYSQFNARLITANEIAEITGKDEWDEKSTSVDMYYFDSLNNETSCSKNCQYGWLYDRTSTNCKNAGCLNNASSTNIGSNYWTASSRASSSSYAWVVKKNGSIDYYGVPDKHGVRPVIEVLKSDLK